ncbi:MAG: DNA primase [Myxococcales bacterium]|nr:MAG: DNA primase [Myxococcales bacterium]
MIGKDSIDRVRSQTKLVELVGETVKLQRRGRSFTGLCPFHKEKTPSFHVNPERGFYHCFGCHASGDAIKFVQETEGLDFVEAVRSLAERVGIELEENESDAERKQQAEARRRQQELYDLNDRAAEYFERMLREHPLSGHARAELGRRGLTPEKPTDEMADALQAFRIGYAPYGWDGLVRYFKEAGLSSRAAETVGLLAPRKTGSGHYDRFRHRLMFAVIDVNGRVVAFSGRSLPDPTPEELRSLGLESMGLTSGEPPAKYVNSSESPVYKKREAVFGLYQSRQALRGGSPCLVVEGNFDVVSLHARGLRNVVAPLGTAFTVEQARQIRRFTTDVVLMFDGDSAGKRATNASREPCQQAELTAKVVTLPTGKDPDDLVRERGAEGVEHLLKHSRGILEYLIDLALSEELLQEGAEARAKSVQFVTKLIAAEKDPTLRELAENYADGLVAARLKIHQDNAEQVRTLKALGRAIQARPVNVSGRGGPAPGGVPAPHRARSRDRRQELALEVLGAIFDFPELIDDPGAELAASVIDGDVALAFAALRQAIQGGRLANPEDVLAKLSPPIHPFALARLAAPRHERLEDAKVELVDNVKKLQSLELKREKSEVTEELEAAQRIGDSKQEDALLLQIYEKARRAREREHA